MTAEQYLEKRYKDSLYVSKNDALDAIDMAKREIAWNIHKMICSRTSDEDSIKELDHYVCGICDY